LSRAERIDVAVIGLSVARRTRAVAAEGEWEMVCIGTVSNQVSELFSEDSGVGLWHVLRTKSRQEKILADELRAMRIACFLPQIRQARYYGRRKAYVELPLFPGYLFLRGTLDQAYQADRTRRIAQIIRVHDQATLNWQLLNVHRALSGGWELDLYPAIQRGVKVRVTSGPMQGLEGVVEDRLRANRIIVQVDLLGQGVSLELASNMLEVID
jgi:transcription antitermination factor NusG